MHVKVFHSLNCADELLKEVRVAAEVVARNVEFFDLACFDILKKLYGAFGEKFAVAYV
jgi:hypothetical protein